MTAQPTIIGVFEDQKKARDVIEALVDAGFSNHEIGFAIRHDGSNAQGEEHAESGSKSLSRGIIGGILGAADALLVPFVGPADASNILGTILPVTEEAIDKLPYPGSHRNTAGATRPDAPMTMPATDTEQEIEKSKQPHTVTKEDVDREERSGLVTGGVVGGIVGAAAAFFIPGIGPAIAGGILAATLGGAAIGGVAGSFLSTFIDLGVPEEKARFYEQELKAGNTIVTIKSDKQPQKAVNLLKQYGASHVEAH